MAGRSRRRRRRLVLVVLLLGGAAWYARSRVTGVLEPWSSSPRPGEPVAPGDPAPPFPSPVSALWAAPAPTPTSTPTLRPSPRPRPAPEPAPQALSEAASTHSAGAPALPDGAAPGPDYTIKGNAGSMLFHPPTSPYYKRTKAEVWFRDADEARAAGFTEWTPKKRVAR